MIVAVAAATIAVGAPAAQAAHKPSAPRPTAPPPLSADTVPADINSAYGSGSFGQWGVDQFGLPAYHYRADEATDPSAKQPELAGGTQAQHQLGNDHIKGMAYNDGYTEFWSQDRLSQWANLYQASSQHYAGGWGYLNVAGHTASTMYLDRPRGLELHARVRGRLLPPAPRRRRDRRLRRGVRAIRQRSGARARRHPAQHDSEHAARQLVRVLGRQPLRPEPRLPAEHRHGRAGMEREGRHAVRRAAGRARGRHQPAEYFRGRGQGPAGRLRDLGKGVLRLRHARRTG